ncbi:MAG: hypothetical protein ABSA13_00020 [Beijerinckiaceae bacterium]|jgi:hypothetical protein
MKYEISDWFILKYYQGVRVMGAGSRFWLERNRLWQESFGRMPLVAPTNDDLDKTIEAALRRAGVNTSTWSTKGYRGLGHTKTLLGLRPLIGDETFRPFSEMRQFWLPLAAGFATYEQLQQVKRLDNRGELLARVREFRRAAEAVENGYRGASRAWGTSPLKTFVASPLGVELAYINLTEGRFPRLYAAMAELESELAVDENAVKVNKNTRFALRAFVAIVGIAWHRLTRMTPSRDKPFKDFVEAATASVGGFGDALDEAIRDVTGQTDWAKFDNLFELLLLTGPVLRDAVKVGPFPDEERSAMYEALYNHESGSPHFDVLLHGTRSGPEAEMIARLYGL